MTLVESMQQEVEGLERLGFPREKSLKAMVLDHGQAYELDREASAQMDKGPCKMCFANATHAALWMAELTYVEGFAYSGIIPVHHAWVINQAGYALEVTWRDGGNDCGLCENYEDEECPWCHGTGIRDGEHESLEGAEYFGIPVPDEALSRIILRRGMYGVLETEEDLATILGKEGQCHS